MKKHTKTYVLLTIVLAVWSVIGIRMFNAFGPDELPLTPKTISTPFKPLVPKTRDSFGISANYRDPFLGKLPQQKSTQKKKAFKKESTVPEPIIQYTGHIVDTESGKSVFFISVNGQQYMLSPGEQMEQLKLVRGTSANITIRIGTTLKKIPLQL